MSVLLGMLTPRERAALDIVARECGDRYRPWTSLGDIRGALRQLTKLGLVDMVRGHLDGTRLVRLSRVAQVALRDSRRTA